MKHIILLSLALLLCTSHGPPNCFLYEQDQSCFTACKEAEQAITFAQGSKASQELFDKSIAHCPSFDYSYYEKAVPYAKRGLMKEWKIMMDKAVAINPIENLAFRGWYHFFFMHNYEAAIRDIEALEALINYDIGYTGDGMYHLNVMKGLCWKGLGEHEKAVHIMKEQIQQEGHDIGMYDHLHLGVFLLDTGKYEAALAELEKQVVYYDVSEIYYYKALCYKHMKRKDLRTSNLEKALDLYLKDQSMSNSYRQLVDEIFLVDIKNEIGI